jgi:hypothetical protein
MAGSKTSVIFLSQLHNFTTSPSLSPTFPSRGMNPCFPSCPVPFPSSAVSRSQGVVLRLDSVVVFSGRISGSSTWASLLNDSDLMDSFLKPWSTRGSLYRQTPFVSLAFESLTGLRTGRYTSTHFDGCSLMATMVATSE